MSSIPGYYAGSRPTSNPEGGTLGVDDLQLERTQPRQIDVMNIVQRSVDLCKAHPTETIGYTLIMFMVLTGVSMVFQVAMQMVMFGFVGAMDASGGRMSDEAAIAMFGVMGLIMIPGVLIISAAQAVGLGGLYMMLLRVIRGDKVDIKDFKVVKRFALPLVGGLFLLMLASMAGMMAFIIPGYILMIGLFLHPMVIVDKNLGAVDSLKASWRLMNGHKLQFFILLILISFVNMLGMLACGLGLIFTYPVSLVALTMFYDELAEPGYAYGPSSAAVENVFV